MIEHVIMNTDDERLELHQISYSDMYLRSFLFEQYNIITIIIFLFINIFFII